jgi:predicted AAA+ superfamily ATPase
MERYLKNSIQELALKHQKMAFISGPRQCGKTTLAKTYLSSKKENYFNWDDKEFRKLWAKNPKGILEPNHPSLIILDEIHKAKNWKRDLKGIFDLFHETLKIIVTGSVKLNTYKKGGDSLLGRYFHFRLHPFSLGELTQGKKFDALDILDHLQHLQFNSKTREIYENLFRYGGFPEPYLKQDQKFANLWKTSRVDRLIREDLRDLTRLPELSQVEMLVALLEARVASGLSIQSLREDLEVAHTTVSRWMEYLNAIYYCYTIQPWSKSIKQSLKKEPKLYLWDWSEVENKGARFENLVANHLLKAVHFWIDTGHGKFGLQYIKNKKGEEVDFLVTRNQKPWLAIECKYADTSPSQSLIHFQEMLNLPIAIQLVHEAGVYKKHKIKDREVWIVSADLFLRNLV